MKMTASVLLVLLCAAFTFAGQTPGAWIKHDSREGRYSILMPAEPKLATQDADNSSGEKFKQYLAMSMDSSAYYMVGYFDYAGRISYSFDKALDGMLENIKGTLISEKAISLGVSPGREIKALAKDAEGREFLLHSRAYDIGRRIYVLTVGHLKSNEGPAQAEKVTKFFDSFQVVTTP